MAARGAGTCQAETAEFGNETATLRDPLGVEHTPPKTLCTSQTMLRETSGANAVRLASSAATTTSTPTHSMAS